MIAAVINRFCLPKRFCNVIPTNVIHVKQSLSTFTDYRKGKKVDLYQDGYFLNISVALVPPKPKEFDMAAVMSCFLATFGT